MSRLKLLAAGMMFSAAVFSQEDKLISGPGSTLTENTCKICHELQHIKRQPLSRGEWADNLRNMKERGTPMDEAETAVILEYLATYYNRERPAPPPAPDTLAGGGDPAQKLLASHGCSGCHALDKRVVGPSFREVAAKYGKDSEDQLMRKIREGGKGVWGQVPMPPNPGVPEADLKAIVAWVLEQK
ncbi:MAG: c-type cytochrome [Betaproteobacteria bacterium]